MLRKQDMTHRGQVEIISLEQLVPADHLVRKIDQVIYYLNQVLPRKLNHQNQVKSISSIRELPLLNLSASTEVGCLHYVGSVSSYHFINQCDCFHCDHDFAVIISKRAAQPQAMAR